MLPLQILLQAGLPQDQQTDLELQEKYRPLTFSGEAHSGVARHGLVLIRARLQGISPIVAASELILESPESPAYISRGFANVAIAIAEDGSELWAHSFRRRSLRALEAGLRVAEDCSLPKGARTVVLAVVKDSAVLSHPERATPTKLGS